MNFGPVFVQLIYIFDIKYRFIAIDDFGVIFWQKLVNSDHVISATGESEVVIFSTKRRDRRNRADLIESTTPCHDLQVAGHY